MKNISNQKKIHYGALDGLRAYSAIGVAMMHILSNGQYKVKGFIFNSFIASLGNLVFLFMMISAFSMCCGYYKRITGQQISIEKFYSRRYQKMWPFFAILCLIDVIISPSKSAIYELFANLTLCFGLLPNANISVIGIGWFLGLIFVFYMIFPFFCFLINNKKRAWTAMIISMIFNVLCRIYFFDRNHMLDQFDVRTNIIYSSMFFMAGGIIYLYKDQLLKIVSKYRILVILLALLFTIGYFYEGNAEPFIMLLLFATLLIYSVGSLEKQGKILENKFTKFIGNISLEIYLCHMVFYRLIEKLHLNHLLGNEIFSYILTVIMTLCCAIVFSCSIKCFLDKVVQRRQ